MLYERWRKIAAERRNEMALSDFVSGRRWTFQELFDDGEKEKTGRHDLFFPQGHSPEFVFSLLVAWRENILVCPLENGQAPPENFRAAEKLHPSQIHFRHRRHRRAFVAFTAEQLMADAEISSPQ